MMGGLSASAATCLALSLATQPTLTSSTSATLKLSEKDMEDIVVTGSRRAVRLSDSIVNTEVLTRDEIEASGAEDLAELLEGTPGIQIDRSFAGAGIRMQGLDPEHTLILVDGQRVNGRINGVIDLQRLFSEKIERVEIVKGPSSALYGSDAMGGVVNVITREGREPFEASVHGAYGSLSTDSNPFAEGQTNTVDTSGRISVRGDKWSATILGGYHQQDAFDLAPEDEATSGSQLTSFNAEARASYSWSDDSRIVARVDYFQRDLKGVEIGTLVDESNDGNPFRPNPTRATFDRQNNVRTFSASLQPTFNLDGPHDISVTGYYSRYEDTFIRDQRGQDINDTEELATDNLGQLTAQYTGSLGTNHVVVAGVEALYEELSTPRIFAGAADRGRLSLFAQDEWLVFERLTVVPGFRIDFDSQFGVFPTPKLALRFDMTENIIFRASYGLGFRSPSFRDLYLRFENPAAGYFVEGNPDLRPETSRGLTVGAEVKLLSRVRLVVEFYRNDISNLIAFLPGEVVSEGELQRFTNDNVEEARTQGIETSVEIEVMSWLQASASYTYLDSQDLQENRPLDGRAEHRVTFRLLADYRPWGLSAWVRGTYVGARPFFVPDDSQPPEIVREDASPYTTIDARIAQQIAGRFKVFFGADNLLNAGDPRFLAIPPFGIYAGLDARY
ncbi:MAG: TonB-dependent receptor [Myxococcota bacterium]